MSAAARQNESPWPSARARWPSGSPSKEPGQHRSPRQGGMHMTKISRPDAADVLARAGDHWGWLMGLGIITLLAGVVVLAWPHTARRGDILWRSADRGRDLQVRGRLRGRRTHRRDPGPLLFSSSQFS